MSNEVLENNAFVVGQFIARRLPNLFFLIQTHYETSEEKERSMNSIWNGNWQGRHSEAWIGSIDELRQLIPNFSIWKEDNAYLGSNKYLDLIVRDPSDSGEVSHGNLVDSVKKAPILIAAVSNGFRRERYRGRQQGYKLVQHHEMLDSILGTLKNKHACVSENSRFRILQSLRNPESLEATLRISEYGARMWIEFPVPNYEFYPDDREPYVLKITCLNSVDRKFALRIGLSLYRDEFSNEIFIAGFHRNHDQELEDGAIEAFLNHEFVRFISGKWIRQTVPAGQIKDLIPDYLNKTDSEKIISLYTQLTKALSEVERRLLQESREMNYFLFRTALSALVHEQETLHSQAQKMAKVLDLLEKIEEENSGL